MNFISLHLKGLLKKSNEWDSEKKTIYEKIYVSLKHSIINGTIPFNSQLPSTRILADDLEVSRSTILKAYELLIFERFIVSKKGSGCFVIFKEVKNNPILKKVTKSTHPKISKRAQLFQKNKTLSVDNLSKTNIAFRPGLPPLDFFPIKIWKRLNFEYWKYNTSSNLTYGSVHGVKDLRITISNYLKVFRGINCDHEQIIIVTGSLHSLYLIGNSVLNSGDKVIMENPTFPRAFHLFKSLQASVIPCELDDEGIDIKTIEDVKAKLIYCTPSNQYPLGIKMSSQRRLELLEWANRNNSLIIEDDYDHEFSNWESPQQTLFSLDTQERVIYQGTFNKLLHPSLRIGYVIVPKYMIKPICAIQDLSSRFVNISNQEILNNFIKNDYLNKHIKTIIDVSLERKSMFVKLTDSFLKFSNNDGLHLVCQLPENVDDFKIHQELLKKDVVTFPLSTYYINPQEKKGLVLGYSSVNEKVMKEKIMVMKEIIQNYKK